MDKFKSQIVIILFIIGSIPFHFHFFTEGLDSSWVYALNLFVSSEYKYGTDLFFNYGPLGFLLRPMNIQNNFFVAQFVWSFIFIFHIYIMYRVNKININWKVLSLSLALFLIGFIKIQGSEYYLCYVVLLCLCLMWKGDRGIIFYGMSILVIITFFTKFSSTIFLLSALLLFCIFMFLNNKKQSYYYIKRIIILIMSLPLLYLLYNPSLKGLIGYVKSSFELSSGYNIAMSLSQNNIYILWVLVIVCCFIFICLFYLVKDKEIFYFLMIFTGPLFLVYKHGFVRADAHIDTAFSSLLWIMSVIILFLDKNKILKSFKTRFEKTSIIAAFAIMISISFLCINVTVNDVILNFRNKTIEIPKTVLQIINDDGNSINLLDEKMKNIIGDETITIYPWEITFVESNELNYIPMPLLQAYNAYTPYLDNLNADLFRSGKIPNYIIFNLNAIDNRLPLLEVPLTWNEIYTNYSVNYYDDVNNLILLKRKKETKFTTIEEQKIVYTNADTINIPEDISRISLDFKLNIKGKIAKLLWKIPEVSMKIEYEDGNIKEGRVILENLKNDVTISSYPYDFYSMADLLNSNGNLSRVKNISFTGKGLNFYDNKIRVNFKKCILDTQETILIPANLNIMSKTADLNLDDYKLINDNIEYHFDKNYIESYTSLTGWAYIGNNAKELGIYIKSDGKIYGSSNIIRNDVVEAFGLINNPKIGFDFNIDASSKELSIILINEKDKTYYEKIII